MNQLETLKNQKDTQDKIVLMMYAALATVVLAAGPGIMYSIQFVQSGQWQWLATAIAIAIIIPFALNAWRIARSGRIALATGWLIGGFAISTASINLFAEGALLSSVFTAFLVPMAVLSLFYQIRRWGLALAIGAAVSLCILAIDRWTPFPRLTVEQGFIWINTSVFGLIILYFAARAFVGQSLRFKLVAAFLVVGVLGVGIMAFLNNRTTTTAFEERVGLNLHGLADSQAVTIGGLLAQQVGQLQSLSLNKSLQDSVEARTVLYSGDPATIQAELEAIDQQWLAASDRDPLVYYRLNNELASELNEFRNLFSDHVELFITDRYGGLVAATNRTSDYYQADEDWWQAAFDGGQGNAYIGQPEFDESSATFGLIMGVPIYAHNSREVVGILRSTYRMTVVTDLLASAHLGQTGRADLYLPDGHTLSMAGTSLIPADPNTLAQLQASATVDYARFTYEGEPSLVSQAPVRAITENPVVDNLGWTLVLHQEEQEALAPVETQTRTGLLWALVIAVLAVAGGIGLAYLLTGPITRLTAVAQQVAGGDLAVQARVESEDEIGQLTTVFNTMTAQLRETIGTLEERVTDRTRQLEAVVGVSQHLTGILDLSDLLRQVVTLTKETFDYYHVHIYLLEGETLIMAEGYGEAGAEMKRRGHSIALAAPQSLVARAAREGQVIIVENVREDPNWLPNPLLPKTHAEMAVPVMLGREVVGVLDVQSEKVGGLTGEDESTVLVLANQVAVAVRNARAFAQTQEALYQAQRLQRLYTGQAWEKFSTIRSTTDYEVRQPGLPPLEQTTTPEVTAALQQEETITLIANGQGAASGGRQGPSKTDRVEAPDATEDRQAKPTQPGSQPSKPGPRLALATPLKLRDEIIGVLGIQDENLNRRWTEDEIALIEAVGEQMSLAIENARLFDDTQRRARRETLARQIADKVRNANDIEEILQITVAELSEALGVSRAFVDLDPKVNPQDK